MTGKTHLEAGIVAGLLFSYVAAAGHLPVEAPPILLVAPISIGCGLVGGVFPDIDIPTSVVGKLTKPISTIINKLVGHRTLFHAPLLYAVLYYIVRTQINVDWIYWVLAPFCYGVISHLILDMLNKSGIPLLYPSRKRYRVLRAKNDGIIERAVGLFLYGIGVMLILSLTIAIIVRIR